MEERHLTQVLPGRVTPHLMFAKYLTDKGNPEAAETAYANALSFLDQEEEIRPEYFLKPAAFYIKQKRYDDALEVLRKGIAHLPEEARIRMAAAVLYEKLGIPYRAVEEYEKALVLDPGNKKARKRLAALR